MALSNLKPKRWAFIALAWFTLVFSVRLIFEGLFITKKEHTNKATFHWGEHINKTAA